VTRLFQTLFLGASPKFHRPEGSEAVLLRFGCRYMVSSGHPSPSTYQSPRRSFILSASHPILGAFRRLSYQSRLQASGRDPDHHQLLRQLLTAWPVMPTPVFLRHGLPASAAAVAQLSCATRGRAFTFFHLNQALLAFTPAGRFLHARLRPDMVRPRYGLKAEGYPTLSV